MALNRFNTEPRLLVTALREQLGESGIATLGELLKAEQSTATAKD